MKSCKSIIITLLLMMSSISAQASCVILLHGLARNSGSMEKLQEKLASEHYQVVNFGYPSRDFQIEKLAELAIKPALKECQPEQAVNFVTHSLGGILVRQYLSQHPIENLRHVVMLGPPNKGSEVVDKLSDMPGYKFINGKAGMQLSTDINTVPNKLGRANFDLGIIAGTSSINLILSWIIPSEDDGKVLVERTRLEGMNDHLSLPVTHTFMMRNKTVIAQVLHYFKFGKFNGEKAY